MLLQASVAYPLSPYIQEKVAYPLSPYIQEKASQQERGGREREPPL